MYILQRHVALFYTTRAAQVEAVIDAIQIDLGDSLANEVQDENEEGARTICEPTHDDQHSDSGEEMQSFDSSRCTRGPDRLPAWTRRQREQTRVT